MKRPIRAMALAGLLAAAAWLLTTSLGRSAEPKDGVEKLAKDIGDGGKPDAKKAADIAKNNELEDVMRLFKPVAKKGLNPLGPKGIELSLIDLAKNGKARPAAGAAKAADIIQAIAEVSKNYKAAGAKDPAAWSKYAEDMQKASQDLRKAARANNAAQIKIAANNIQSACTNCHEKFR